MHYWIINVDTQERVSVATCSWEIICTWLRNARTRNPSRSFEIVDDLSDPYPANAVVELNLF